MKARDFPELDHADRIHVDAAEGWLGLGNFTEAEQELEQLSPAAKIHPTALQVRCLVYSEAKKWERCADCARKLVDLVPEDSFGWINRAYALRRVPGGTVQAAYEALLPAAAKVEQTEEVFFNLACYTCVLDRLDEARKWLKRCFEQANLRGRLNRRRQEALHEPDLKSLWPELKADKT